MQEKQAKSLPRFFHRQQRRRLQTNERTNDADVFVMSVTLDGTLDDNFKLEQGGYVPSNAVLCISPALCASSVDKSYFDGSKREGSFFFEGFKVSVTSLSAVDKNGLLVDDPRGETYWSLGKETSTTMNRYFRLSIYDPKTRSKYTPRIIETTTLDSTLSQKEFPQENPFSDKNTNLTTSRRMPLPVLVSLVENGTWYALTTQPNDNDATIRQIQNASMTVYEMDKMLTALESKFDTYSADNIPVFGYLVFVPQQKHCVWHITATLEFWVRDKTQEIPAPEDDYSYTVELELSTTNPIGFIFPQLYCIGQKGMNDFKTEMEKRLKKEKKTWDDVNIKVACRSVSWTDSTVHADVYNPISIGGKPQTTILNQFYPVPLSTVVDIKTFGIVATDKTWVEQSVYSEKSFFEKKYPNENQILVLDSIPDDTSKSLFIRFVYSNGIHNFSFRIYDMESDNVRKLFFYNYSQDTPWSGNNFILYLPFVFTLESDSLKNGTAEEVRIPVTFTFAVQVEEKVVPGP